MGYIILLVIVVSDLYKFNIVCGLETSEFWRQFGAGLGWHFVAVIWIWIWGAKTLINEF